MVGEIIFICHLVLLSSSHCRSSCLVGLQPRLFSSLLSSLFMTFRILSSLCLAFLFFACPLVSSLSAPLLSCLTHHPPVCESAPWPDARVHLPRRSGPGWAGPFLPQTEAARLSRVCPV
ncbi:unnamed protein product [Protopolystoma xenopodis]|uniref:Uncharacterized protein n=1 Tax=Protopolystoma xenopodis TaxID=117903 RepID=A0A3S5ARP4_9PLAT|nr:unnamed protein product [Protopolystoma xenopodis]